MKHTHTETDLAIENQYPKLVRDRIPEIVERNGQTAPTHIAEQDEYIQHLLAKLVEEATELKHAEGLNHQKEEMADVREVLETLQEALGFAEQEIRDVQTSKATERGGFRDRIIMDAKASQLASK
jgi:predicted house-cleaning noncanonical NTP pyrophosphatase (MazG superfamily)